MTRFVILRWTPARSDLRRAARAHADRLEGEAGFDKLLEWRGLAVLCAETAQGQSPIVLPHDTGFVFGVLFHRDNPTRVAKISYEAALPLAESGGASLFHDYWGAYVALLVDRGRDHVHVLRDPMGAQPCYLASQGDVRCVCSHVSDLHLISPCAPRPERVRAFLAMPHLVSQQTALDGVEALLPGERLTAGRDGETRTLIWTPPRAAESAQSFADAAAELRLRLQQSATAWSSVRPRIVHRLSGGLDSSAVLGLLRQARGSEEIICVNESSAAAPEGDEREVARAVSAHFGVSLKELAVRAEEVCFERVLDAPLMASPSMTVFSFAHRAYDDVAAEAPDALLTSGQGGDQAFYRTRSTLIAAEAARRNLAPWAWCGAAYDVARLSGKSFWRVAGDALWYGVAHAPPRAAEFFQPGAQLARDARAGAHSEQLSHSWLAYRHVGPAQTGRILSLLQAQHYDWPNGLSALFATANPILAQPVIEHVLNIPASVLTQGGRDRALYRAAVADLIPAPVFYRITKGQTTRHFAEVAALNLGILRETLMDGALCAGGVIDRCALEEVFARSELTTLAQMDNLLIAFAAEAWLRGWQNASRRTADAAA